MCTTSTGRCMECPISHLMMMLLKKLKIGPSNSRSWVNWSLLLLAKTQSVVKISTSILVKMTQSCWFCLILHQRIGTAKSVTMTIEYPLWKTIPNISRKWFGKTPKRSGSVFQESMSWHGTAVKLLAMNSHNLKIMYALLVAVSLVVRGRWWMRVANARIVMILKGLQEMD